jgi:hypothetical protein
VLVSRAVREVQTHDIDTGSQRSFKHVGTVQGWAKGRHDFGPPHYASEVNAVTLGRAGLTSLTDMVLRTLDRSGRPRGPTSHDGQQPVRRAEHTHTGHLERQPVLER